MYEWGGRAGEGWGGFRDHAPLPSLFIFFDPVGAFGVVSRMLDSLLCLGFFHRSFGLFGALGAGHRSLFALFLLQFLAAEEFDKRRVSTVTLAPPGANNAQV